MIVIDSYDGYKYTKVKVLLKLNACPSDFEDCEYYLDIQGNNFIQQNCFIGAQFLEKIEFRRVSETNMIPRWETEIIIAEVKKEEEVLAILNELCFILSLNCSLEFKGIQNSGLVGFTFDNIDVKRSYAVDKNLFGDIVIGRYSVKFEQKTIRTLNLKVFELPKFSCKEKEFLKDLKNSFFVALQSSDPVARYLLLYYLLEKIYETPEYKNYKTQYNGESSSKKTDGDKKRASILCQYFVREIGLKEYCSFGSNYSLEVENLERIIKTRNDLTHRADTSCIQEIMYQHLIPIIQKMLNLLSEKDNKLL